MLSLAALGRFSLSGAVLVDAGTALLVLLNGMTVLWWARWGAPDQPAGASCHGSAYATKGHTLEKGAAGAPVGKCGHGHGGLEPGHAHGSGHGHEQGNAVCQLGCYDAQDAGIVGCVVGVLDSAWTPV